MLHECVTRASVRRGVLPQLREWLREDGYKKVLAVADVNTEPAAREVLSALHPISPQLFVFDNPCLSPDEAAVGRLLVAADPASGGPYDALLAVGSGTLNDLTRYVAYRLGLPYYVAATAASMDGYASSVAPLTVGGMKLTYPAVAPKGVVGETALLDTAPWAMTAAGYGDVAGKFTSVNDWELESIVMGEAADYHAGQAFETLQTANACLKITPDGSSCAGYASPAEAVMDALIKSGLVMQQAGHSKPASGSEHHLSHFWEMRMLLTGRTPALHGAKVGVALLAALRVNEWLLSEQPSWDHAYQKARAFDPAVWREETRRVFGQAADGVLPVWGRETAADKVRELDVICAEWENIKAVIRRNLPSREAVEAGLVRMRCPVSPAEIGVSRDDFFEGILYAQRLRKRFTVWRLADLLGVLPGYAERLEGEM